MWMKRRRWRLAAVLLLAIVMLLDTAAWLLATTAMTDALAAWTAQQRARGLEVALDAPVRGGWPLAATLRFAIRLGPHGAPAGAILEASLASSVSLLHPGVLRSAVDRASLAGPGGATIVATGADWMVDVALADPHRARVSASLLHLAWADRGVTVASLVGDVADNPSGLVATLRARDIDFAGAGLRLPQSVGTVAGALDLDAVLHGGLPPPADTAEASARAWQRGGGEIEVDRASLRYGALDLTASGRVGLDAGLLPSGAGVASVHGLGPVLEALGEAGTIPLRSAQAAAGVLVLFGGGADGGADIPLAVADGRLAVAGIPLLRLPRPAWVASPSAAPPQ